VSHQKYDEAEAIGAKMMRVIDSADLSHKACVERFCCLANKRLHELVTPENVFGLAGMGMGLQQRFESKLGCFRIQEEPIVG